MEASRPPRPRQRVARRLASRAAVVALAGLMALLVSAPAEAAARLHDPEPCDGCWQPALETSWQWQLQDKIDGSYDVAMYDIDGFDNTKRLVGKLHDDGRAVVCYVSAGSWEDWRPDAGDFPDSVLGRKNGWPGER